MSSGTLPESDNLLRPPQAEPEPLQRLDAEHTITTTFVLKERTYQQQFSDIYFLRLAKLKPVVDELAAAAWENDDEEEEEVRKVDRVLDVRQGELCWVTGTVYMDMPLKPNVLDDISKDHWIAAPPSREKYTSPGNDQAMLEDESGRIRLCGAAISSEMLVTGCVISVKGSETMDGDFEVIDILYPELPPQVPLKKGKRKGKYVAIVSGLGISGELHESFETHLLVEYLLGELTGVQDQTSASKITRLILAGNSLSDSAPLSTARDREDTTKPNKSKKYGYDSAAYNPLPIQALDNLLSSLLPSIPIDLMPGDSDPANVSLPQQPLHPTLFPNSRPYLNSTFNSLTNPYEAIIDGVNFLGTSGQTIDDIYKYVEDNDRLAMIERTLRWRNIAPTCPDTLWSYPFQNTDPFVIDKCPHVYFIGNQPKFEERLVEGENGQRCRIVAVPRFAETGEVVLVELETLEVEVVRICVEGI